MKTYKQMQKEELHLKGKMTLVVEALTLIFGAAIGSVFFIMLSVYLEKLA